MPKQIRRKDVDWDLANCLGLDPELFFKQQSELLAEGASYLTLRRICFNCPIWKECLQVGTQSEAYGFWGGLSDEERKQVYTNAPARRYAGLIRDLKFFPHIKLDEIISLVTEMDRPYGFGRFWAKW